MVVTYGLEAGNDGTYPQTFFLALIEWLNTPSSTRVAIMVM